MGNICSYSSESKPMKFDKPHDVSDIRKSTMFINLESQIECKKKLENEGIIESDFWLNITHDSQTTKHLVDIQDVNSCLETADDSKKIGNNDVNKKLVIFIKFISI